MPTPQMRDACAGAKFAGDDVEAFGEQPHGVLGRRIAIGIAHRAAHAADEIQQHEIGAAAADLQADGKRAIGIERQRHRRLADLALLRFLFQQQPVGFELLDDDRHRLRRESGKARDLGLRQAAMAADQRQRQALIIETHPALIGAAGRVGPARRPGARAAPIVLARRIVRNRHCPAVT